MSDNLPRFDKHALLVLDDSFQGRRALMVEEDPKTLDGHARALWHQWQAPVKGRKNAAIKADVAWLTEQYAEAQAPIPHELSLLISAIVNPVRNSAEWRVHTINKAAYREAIEFEASFPTGTTAYKVATHLVDRRLLQSRDNKTPQKSAESTVKGWQRSSHYNACIRHRRMELKKQAQIPLHDDTR